MIVVTGSGLLLPGLAGPEPDDLSAADRARLRRMDRYGRAGFLAGARALESSGAVRRAPPDPDAGVVFGTAHGCRDSITEHARLLREAASSEALSPAVFAQTVHNTVCGELAIAWGLGGVSETLVSGRTAAAEAILEAATRVANGAARRAVAGGAEGIHPLMSELWVEERTRYGPGFEALEAVEAAGALVLSGVSGVVAGVASFVGGAAFFEPDPDSARERLREFLVGVFEGRGPGLLVLASPDLDGAFRGLGGVERTRDLAAESGELFGAAAAVGAVLSVRSLERGDHTTAAVVCREPSGSTALLAFAAA